MERMKAVRHAAVRQRAYGTNADAGRVCVQSSGKDGWCAGGGNVPDELAAGCVIVEKRKNADGFDRRDDKWHDRRQAGGNRAGLAERTVLDMREMLRIRGRGRLRVVSHLNYLATLLGTNFHPRLMRGM